ncbi:FKBP-type peptidyl-prolyl cis-trans isomerase [Nonomuraea rubra]
MMNVTTRYHPPVSARLAPTSGVRNLAQAVMVKKRRTRRLVVACGGVVVLLVVLGIAFSSRPWEESLTVTGAFGEQPKVVFGKGASPGEELSVETAIKGMGAAVAQDDLLVADFVSYVWRGTSQRQIDSSHSRGRPAVMPIGELVPGLSKGLIGKSVGSRIVLSIPPRDGYGDQGMTPETESSEQTTVTGADTLVYVVDLLATYPKTASARGTARPADPALPQVQQQAAGAAPTVEIPRSDPPDELQVETLIEGAGPAVRPDHMLISHYQGQVWRTGKVFDSSWSRGEVAPLSSLSGTIPGIIKGLAGAKVGSRVLLVIPPKDGYGRDAAQPGIEDTDTLVFLFDILGAY